MFSTVKFQFNPGIAYATISDATVMMVGYGDGISIYNNFGGEGDDLSGGMRSCSCNRKKKKNASTSISTIIHVLKTKL